MHQHILPILALSATLLGLYIIIVSFKSSDAAAEYHIGCYLSTMGSTRNHHQTQSSLLEEIDRLNEENSRFFKDALVHSGEKVNF